MDTWTVAELIEALRDFPQDWPVFFRADKELDQVEPMTHVGNRFLVSVCGDYRDVYHNDNDDSVIQGVVIGS